MNAKPFLICLVLLLGGCCKPEPRIVYRIPADKQDAAAKLTVQLWEQQTKAGRNACYISDDVRNQVERLYGEPVVIKP